MSARTKPPFRADHVGSLLRPPDLLRGARRPRGRADRRRRAARGRGRRDPRRRSRMQKDVGLADGHRRRVPPHLVAHGLHLLSSSGISAGRRREHPRPVPQRGGRVRLRAAGDARRPSGSRCRQDDLRRRLRVPARQRCRRHHGRSSRSRRRAWSTTAAATPRSTTRSTRTSTTSGSTSTTAYARADPALYDARLPLPPARRHEPRLHQRPGAARAHRGDRRRPRAPARAVHREHQPRAGRPPGRPRGHHAPLPRQQPVDVGGRGRLRLRGRGAVQRPRRRRLLPRVRRRALGRLRAAALRARRASRSCSAWSPPRSPQLEDKDMLKRRIEEASKFVDIDQLCLSAAVRLLLDRGGQQPHASTSRRRSCGSSSRRPRRSGARRSARRPALLALPRGSASSRIGLGRLHAAITDADSDVSAFSPDIQGKLHAGPSVRRSLPL